MKLHSSAIEKIVYLFETYGGTLENRRVKEKLANLNFMVYERKTDGEKILVLVEDFLREINKSR